MSKKIQEKKAKKPRPERVTLASLNRKVDLLDSRLRTLNAWETMQDAMEESRSAPAEEMAKPLEFGMKVRTTQGDGFVHGVYGDGCTHPTGRWWIAFPYNVLNHYARKDITIID